MIAASLLPNPSTTIDSDIKTALGARGATAAQVATFEKNGGLVPLRPIAEMFGEAALVELLERLRYTKAQLLNPPTSHDGNLTKALKVKHPEEILAARLLLTIPGHFRELARKAAGAQEAFALENLGWLLMQSLRDSIGSATGKRWWLPSQPIFVTPFSSTLPALSSAVQKMILRSGQIDNTLSFPDYQARCKAWMNGLAGKQWRMETRVDPASPAAGRPFYVQMVNVPASVNIATQKQRSIAPGHSGYRRPTRSSP